MKLSVITSIIICFVVLILVPSSSASKFRPDYHYEKRTKAYYKLHIEPTRISDAKAICTLEGASLMIPASNIDVSVVHGMMKKFPDIGDYVWVGDDEQNHPSAEEEPIIDLTEPTETSLNLYTSCEVITRSAEVMSYHNCWQSLPYICKIEEKDITRDDLCGANTPGYTLINGTGSCYKVPYLALTWNGAYAECQNEGAHLLVLNSEVEMLAIKKFLKKAPRVRSAVKDYFYFAGFRADKESKVFKTIFNETLDEAGFNRWSEGEPNNANDSEYCGSVFRNNGLFNDVNCEELFAFICEKELHA